MATASDNKQLAIFIEQILNSGFYRSRLATKPLDLEHYITLLFRDLHFKDKNVLDIGGGIGLFSFCAPFLGAKKVVCLEPEAFGSSSGMIDTFNNLKRLLNCTNVQLENSRFQEFKTKAENYDIILLHNSINHLNEKACQTLLYDRDSFALYEQIFRKLFLISKKNAKLIICDCSRYNFFHFLKIKNPFAPTIEWNKHQAPETWARLLMNNGFKNPRIRWLSFKQLRSAGQILFGNKVIDIC